jgi:hypothetical protein
MRNDQGLQVINFLMLAAALLSAGYVSALGARLYALAGAVGLIGIAIAIVAYLVMRRLVSVGTIAEEPLAALQDRLAEELGIESLRMISRLRHVSDPAPKTRMSTQVIYACAIAMTVVLAVAATAYAWFGH